MYITNEKVVLVNAAGKSIEIETFESEKEMVHALIENTNLKCGSYFGSPEHEAALADVEKSIAIAREKISVIRMKG